MRERVCERGRASESWYFCQGCEIDGTRMQYTAGSSAFIANSLRGMVENRRAAAEESFKALQSHLLHSGKWITSVEHVCLLSQKFLTRHDFMFDLPRLPAPSLEHSRELISRTFTPRRRGGPWQEEEGPHPEQEPPCAIPVSEALCDDFKGARQISREISRSRCVTSPRCIQDTPCVLRCFAYLCDFCLGAGPCSRACRPIAQTFSCT